MKGFKRTFIAALGLDVLLVAFNTVYFTVSDVATEIEPPSLSDTLAREEHSEKEARPWKDSVPENNDYGVK